MFRYKNTCVCSNLICEMVSLLERTICFSPSLIVQGEGMNFSEMEECLCLLYRLFKHFTVPTFQNGPFTYIYIYHLHVGHSTFIYCRSDDIWILKHVGSFLHWVAEDSPFIWQESNLLVWAHLEFVSTENLNIYAPTNIHQSLTQICILFLQISDPLKTLFKPSPDIGISR